MKNFYNEDNIRIYIHDKQNNWMAVCSTVTAFIETSCVGWGKSDAMYIIMSKKSTFACHRVK